MVSEEKLKKSFSALRYYPICKRLPHEKWYGSGRDFQHQILYFDLFPVTCAKHIIHDDPPLTRFFILHNN